MEKKLSYIYKICSPTGKIYIGKTINLKERKSSYKFLKCKKQVLIYRSLLKYGFSGHTFEVVYEGENTSKELNELEIYFIGFFKSFNGYNNNGLNLTLGGEGGFGRKISDEQKRKIVAYNKTRIYTKHTEETKKLISESRKKTGKTPSQQNSINNSKGKKLIKTIEWIKNNAESIKKPIIQFDLNDNFIREWKSAKDVELEIGLSRKNIGENLRNKTKQAYGYKWKFKNKKNSSV